MKNENYSSSCNAKLLSRCKGKVKATESTARKLKLKLKLNLTAVLAPGTRKLSPTS